jgi:hypothetical protein
MDVGVTDAPAGMQRPRRQAALAAMDNIRRVREWEEMNENSKRFRECAAQIDAEFRAEEKHRAVRSEDLDADGEDEAESCEEEEAFLSANDSFVSDDDVSEASEYTPCDAEAQEAEADEEDADNEEEEPDDEEEEDGVECEAGEDDGVECVSEEELESAECSQAATPPMHGPGDTAGAGDAA